MTMKKLAALAMLAGTSIASAHPPAGTQAALDAWNQGQSGGVALAWVDADGAAFFQAGKFDASDPRPITPDTQFELGSITKVFTALLLADSEQAGRVNRLDPAAKYLVPAGDPAQADLAKITLLALSTHTSGLPRLPYNIGPNPDGNPDPYAAYDRAALIDALRHDGRGAPAGRAVAYSNFGVSVLGEAVGTAWGTTYANALQTRILTPLGLGATSLGLAGTPAPADLAPGHVGDRRVPNWTWLACAPAGGLRSSARDMAKFLAASLGDERAALHAAFVATEQPERTDPDLGGHIGLGWLITDDPLKPVFWHNGATAGSHAVIAFCPKAGVGIVILANQQKGAEELAFSLLGSPFPRPAAATVPNAADYVGAYPLTPAFVLQVTTVNGMLIVQGTGQPQLLLRPGAPDRFAVVGVPAEISFERDPAGKVVALVLHQNGFDQRALRGELPPPPKEIALPVETLREYVGSYPLAPAIILTVTEEGGALMVQVTGQAKLPVFASAKDAFFYKVVNAQITFDRGPGGLVTGLVLHQNGRDLPAKKAP
jgi:CubicO group peptidase (beta-lactamase class C family)